MNWSNSEREALCAAVIEEEGVTLELATPGGIERMLRRMELIAQDWDWNALLERGAVREAQRLAQARLFDEE